MLLKGNCLELLAEMPDNSVDSIVTDPPYELGFMGKSWDNLGIAYNVELWSQALRVLKPGGHLLAFGGSRTYHRLASAVEDAGFEIRDQIMWLYGSGFPKSLNIAKSIENKITTGSAAKNGFHKLEGERTGEGRIGMYDTVEEQGFRKVNPNQLGAFNLDPTTPEAQQWQGWGTALKPAHEPIVVARKPLIGTVATNVLTYGTGALNIDASRVAHQSEADRASATPQGKVTSNLSAGAAPDVDNAGRVEVSRPDTSLGRWPANVIHDGSEEVLEGFPNSKSGKPGVRLSDGFNSGVYGTGMGIKSGQDNGEYGDSGSAARFFYCAKASKSERNAGLDIEQFPLKNYTEANKMGGAGDTMLTGSGNPRDSRKQNFHPTVKPIALMRYLVKLVTPPNGTVLDPFLGSGTTAVAAILEGFNWMGCEMTEDYWPIIEARVAWAEAQPKTLL